jgi:hypothetical protein
MVDLVLIKKLNPMLRSLSIDLELEFLSLRNSPFRQLLLILVLKIFIQSCYRKAFAECHLTCFIRFLVVVELSSAGRANNYRMKRSCPEEPDFTEKAGYHFAGKVITAADCRCLSATDFAGSM